jgi:glycoside/pentoside/hexuronide:cation symporter, GPH family
MAKYRTAREDIVPFGQKIAFGSGHLANQLFPAALGVFMVILILALKMNPFLAGLLGAIPRLLDALTDPIMGYISDNTRSRWGRRKPYIFLGSIITGFAFMIMWQLNPENSQSFNFFYFLTLSIVFYIGYTIFATPLIGLGYEMTPDYNERTRLMAVSQWMGQMAWMIAPWFWVIIYNEKIYETAPQGARNLAIWVGALCMLLGIMPALFNKELVLPDLQKPSKLSMSGIKATTKDFLNGIKQTIYCKPFIKLCGATFLVFNGYQTVAQFAFFIIIFYLFNGDTTAAGNWPAWFGTVSALATAFLVIPLITWISTKVGKRNAFIIATLISIVGYGLKWWGFNPDNPYMMFIPVPLISFGIGGLFTLMMSMTADVCDLDELKTGERREGTFGAVYWWMVKLGTAMALLTSGAVLSLVGFDAEATVQAAGTLTRLRIADILIPITTGILAILIMWKYDVTEEKAYDIRQALVKMRGKVQHQGETVEAAQPTDKGEPAIAGSSNLV